MAALSDKDPVRVFLWAIPRTLSTVFQKCIAHTKSVQIVNEPYASAYFKDKLSGQIIENVDAESIRPEKESSATWFTTDVVSFEWVKATLEATYPGKSVIFCKDMAHCVKEKPHMLPRCYRHTFLIRHPHKVFPSWKTVTQKVFQMKEEGFRMQDVPEPMVPKKYGYGEMWDLVEYLKENEEGASPIVIDAGDLQASPVSVMRQYCDAVGIPFTESMLQWPAGTDILDDWIISSSVVATNRNTEIGGFYDAAFNSTQFLPPSKIPSRDELEEDILELVDASMPYYEKLYKMRIKP